MKENIIINSLLINKKLFKQEEYNDRQYIWKIFQDHYLR